MPRCMSGVSARKNTRLRSIVSTTARSSAVRSRGTLCSASWMSVDFSNTMEYRSVPPVSSSRSCASVCSGVMDRPAMECVDAAPPSGLMPAAAASNAARPMAPRMGANVASEAARANGGDAPAVAEPPGRCASDADRPSPPPSGGGAPPTAGMPGRLPAAAAAAAAAMAPGAGDVSNAARNGLPGGRVEALPLPPRALLLGGAAVARAAAMLAYMRVE